ncbi:MAG: hypothetical protein NZ890_21415 [Myxococcota bacterium]|nr:hypothetical protein [Myxococcota bacterium]
MNVDVIYQGLPIVRGAPVRLEQGSLFVEMDGPMPVATRLTLVAEERRLDGLVQRIREGAGSGIYFAPEGGALPDWIWPPPPNPVETAERAAPAGAAAGEDAVAGGGGAGAAGEGAAAEAATAEPVVSPPSQAPVEGSSGPMPSSPSVAAAQEMAVPSLEEGFNGEVDSGPVERRPFRKKKSPRRR